LNAMNLCKPQQKLCDMKTFRLMNDLWRKTFRRAYCTCVACVDYWKTLAV